MPNFAKEEIVALEDLGKGGFGSVRKVYHTRKNKFLAIKSSFGVTNNTYNQMINEHILLSKIETIRVERVQNDFLQSNEFLQYYGAFRTNENYQKSLSLFIENGLCTLEDFLVLGKTYNYQELIWVLRGLVKELSILQRNGIANRGIKPQNIIIAEQHKFDSNKNYLYHISDFGIGCFLHPGENLISSKNLTGLTEFYASPEVMHIKNCLDINLDYSEPYNPFRADVYSLGLVVLRMINSKFKKEDFQMGFAHFLEKNKILMSSYEKLYDILAQMLEKLPINRIDFFGLENALEKLRNDGIRPSDEIQYYEKLADKQEEKLGTSIETKVKNYFRHKALYFAYNDNMTYLSKTEYHLERCLSIINELKERPDQNNMNNLDLEEEDIEINNNLGYLWIKGKTTIAETKLMDTLKKCYKLVGSSEKEEEFKNDSYDYDITKFSCFSNVLNNVGLLYQEMGILMKSEEYFLKSLRIKEKIYGENHQNTADSYINLGKLYYSMGNPMKAKNLLLKSLEIRRINGEKDEKIAKSYDELAGLNIKIGNFLKAEQFFLKSLKIKQNLYGEIHIDIANSYSDLGFLYKKMGNERKAEEFSSLSFKVRRMQYVENNREMFPFNLT